MYYVQKPKVSTLKKFIIVDNNDNTVALVDVKEDAEEIVAALNLVENIIRKHDGFLNDDEVNGADLVDTVNDSIKFYYPKSGGIRFKERG